MVRIGIFLYVVFSTFSVIVFFFPLYLQSKGLNPGQVGVIFASGSLVAMIAQPFWGYFSDKRKTIKHVLVVLLIASLLLSFGLFSVGTMALILMFYIVFMCFNSGVAPLSETLCFTYAQQNKKDFGRVRLWGEVGVGTSALMLGFLVERVGMEQLGLIYALALTAALVAALLLRDVKASTAPVNLRLMAGLFAQPRLLWLLLLILLVAIPHRMNDSMLALYLSKVGASESQVGQAWLIGTISTVPTLLIVGRLIRKWNELGIFIIAAAAYMARWLIYAQADSATMLILCQALNCLTFPLFLVASLNYLFTLVPVELRATGQAAFAVTFGGIGGIIGSAGGGYLMEQLGPQATYGVAAALAATGLAAAIGTYLYNYRKNAA